MLLEVFGSEGALDRMASINPIGRIGRPEEIADAVAWLFRTNRRITPDSP
jgi:NAD(P)-dependent dehydrogenase (short-subunit alcohol dehydrogenase family)